METQKISYFGLCILVLFIIFQCNTPLAQIAVWVADAMKKVQPSAAPQNQTSVQLSSAKNEVESFQIVVSGSNININEVTLAASDLVKQDDTISASNYKFYREHFLYIKKASNTHSIGRYGGPPVFVPDALVPYDRQVPPTYDPDNPKRVVLDLNSVYNKMFWVDLYVPSNVKPGDYRGTITVRVGAQSFTVSVSLHVWNFVLPAQNNLKVAFHFSPYAAEQGHNVGWNEQYMLAQEYAKTALADRMLFYSDQRQAPPYAYNNGVMTLNWTEFDQLVGPMLDGTISPSGRGFNAYAIPTPTDFLGGEAQLKYVSTPLSAENELKVVLYWREFAKHFKEKGWFSKLFLYNTDEPNPQIYNKTLYFSKLAFYADPGIPVMVTKGYDTALDKLVAIDPADPKFNSAASFYPVNSNYNPALPSYDRTSCGPIPVTDPSKCKHVKPAIDIWDPVNRDYDFRNGNFTNDPQIYAAQQASGRHVWWYLSCVSWTCTDTNVGQWGTDYDIGSFAMDAESIYIRHVLWLTRFYNVEGLLTWGTVEGFRATNGKDPWINQFNVEAGSGGNGDGTFFYPGRPDGAVGRGGNVTIGGSTHIAVSSIRMKILRDALEDYEYFKLLDNAGKSNFVNSQIARVVRNTQTWSHNYQDYMNIRALIAQQLEQLGPPPSPPTNLRVKLKTDR